MTALDWTHGAILIPCAEGTAFVSRLCFGRIPPVEAV
jgi:hypothetical protein